MYTIKPSNSFIPGNIQTAYIHVYASKAWLALLVVLQNVLQLYHGKLMVKISENVTTVKFTTIDHLFTSLDRL